MKGYRSVEYAHSLSDFGEPIPLAEAGGCLLRRAIPGTDFSDFMGCYPLCSCSKWEQWEYEVLKLSREGLSVVLVTDPFGSWSEGALASVFPDCFRLYKHHYVVHFTDGWSNQISRHHRYYARRTLKECRVECGVKLSSILSVWDRLYEGLIDRHKLEGIHRFSPASFLRLAEVPGVTATTIARDGEIIGAQIWVVDPPFAYSHLTAVSDVGYRLRASYGLYAASLEYLSPRVDYADLGASAGTTGNGGDGLSEFKKGWANASRPVYLCGKVLQRDPYAAVVRSARKDGTDFFPAYRAPDGPGPRAEDSTGGL